MPKITIPQDIAGIISGVASVRAKTIDMGPDNKFAVGGPSHLNLGWTCHKTEEAALRRYRTLKNAGHDGIVILDATGGKAEMLMSTAEECRKCEPGRAS